jgi:hypothetical protein
MNLQKASNLADAHLNLTMRRKTKIFKPAEFKAKESVPMGELTVELLRRGLDSPSDLHKYNSMRFNYDDLGALMNSSNERQIPIQDNFDEKRMRIKSFAPGSKRPNDGDMTDTSPHLHMKRL